MSKVYWIKGRSPNIYRNISARVDAVLDIEELSRLILENHSLAIKINLSELGSDHYLPPIVTTAFFERIRAKGAKPVVTDSGTLFKGPRFDGHDWMNTALMLGYPIGEALDNQMMLVGGYTNEEGKFYPSEGEHLGGVELGSLVTDVNNLVVLSHVTAHPLCGVAGAVCNLGLGLLTRSGKARVHSCLEIAYDESLCEGSKACLGFCPTGAITNEGKKISFDPRTCNGCLGCFMACPHSAISVRPEGIPTFQESVVEAAKVAVKNIRGRAFFINCLSSVTPQSDDFPFCDIPFVPDFGFLASDDPVALDWVTYQMILRSPGIPGSIAEDLNVLEKGAEKIEAITGISPIHMLEYAQKMELGQRECEFLIGS